VAANPAPPAPVYVVSGTDPTLRHEAMGRLIDELIGSDDRSLALDEFDVAAPSAAARASVDSSDLRAEAAVVLTALDAARTFPFGTSRRVIVVRSANLLTAEETKSVVAYLAQPEPTTVLVLELGEKAPSAALTKALTAVGGVTVGGDAKLAEVLAEHSRHAGLRLERDAIELVTSRLGEDVGRVPALVEVLVATFGAGTRLGAAEIEPYLGEAGGVPVFELTNAIDEGDLSRALTVLHRLREASGMHPLQLMAVLHGHYRRLLRLDDPTVQGEQAAVNALKELGGRPPHPYVAKKALQQARALDSAGIRAAYDLLARADLDLRGASRAPDDAIIEVLVSRLVTVTRQRRRGTPAQAASGRGARTRR
jgi:DNA polymerase III subunit delta